MIAVVDSGRVVEVDSHRPLLAHGGAYAALVQVQLSVDVTQQTTMVLPRLLSTSPLSSYISYPSHRHIICSKYVDRAVTQRSQRKEDTRMQAKPNRPRPSKAEAQTIVGKCKQWLIAGSIVAFGILSGVVAGRAVESTSNQATPASNGGPTISSSNGSTTSPSNIGSFLQQQGGTNFGNNNFGQPPVSGSQTS